MDKKLFEEYKVEDFIADETFINYYCNTNRKDFLFWKTWISEHPEKEVIVREAGKTIETLSLTLSEEEFTHEFGKIKKAIEKRGALNVVPRLSQMPGHQSYRKRPFVYAVLLMVIIFAVGYWFSGSPASNEETLTATVNNTNLPQKLVLSDSTVVTLQPHAKIKYPKSFTRKIRNVYLQGDAGFSVKRNIEHPFKVHSENMVATVLGTVFNVKRAGDSALVVELLKGKLNVEIVNEKMETLQSVLLSPNERAVYVRSEKHLYKNLIVTVASVKFSKSGFNEIAEKLKSVYGIVLINKSPKTQWSFTGEFNRSTAKNIIENICLVKNLTYTEQGDTFLIK